VTIERAVLLTKRIVVDTALSLFVILGTLCGAGCTSGTPALEIESSQARLSPAMYGVGSAFLTIVNKGNGNDTLVAASVDIPGTTTELHDVQNGRMTKIDKIVIPSNGSVILRPGSLHIMIFDMPHDIKAGRNFTLTLRFLKSGEKRVPVQFTNSSPMREERHGR
jgi:copper(I)-binding protein